MCHKTTLDDTELWHQKLGHLNYRLLTRIMKIGAIKGVPMLKRNNLEYVVHVNLENNKRHYIKPFRIKQHQRCYNYFIWIFWDQCKLKVWPGKATPEVRVIEKGQSSEPSLKEKKSVEKDTYKETPEIVKEKVSKLQAIMDLQDPIRKEPSSRVKKNHPSELILGNLDKQMVIR